MRKKIIVSVTNDISTDQRVHKVCQSLESMGFEVILWGRKLSYSRVLNRSYTTKRMKLFFFSGPLFYLEYNFRLFFILLFSKCHLLLSNDLDTLLANFLVSKCKVIPLVYDSHELFPEAPELINRTTKKKIWEILESWILPKIKYSYTVCHSIAKFYKNKYGIAMEVVRNVPYLSQSSSPQTSSKTIIYQGGMNPGRGLELAIEMMYYLDDFKLKIIGDGDELNALKVLTQHKELEHKVEFLGRLPYDDLKAHTKQAIIGILFEEARGLSFEYSLPNKLFDYIHADTPVLASSLVEVKGIMNHYQIGELICERTPQGVARQIKDMSQNLSSYDFAKAKKELNWQNEFKILEGVFSPFLDKS
tara:strand:- start:1571 stop:2653 length:1083 start_codon:yes stop_codon:yes gene_type:complete